MIQKLKLCLIFYRSCGFVSLLVSLICAYFFLKDGVSVYMPLFWLKAISVALVYFYIKEYRKHEFYFYKNLGISKKALWVFYFSFDLFIHICLTVFSLNLNYEKYS